MKTALIMDYHIDKLTLIYKVPTTFRSSALTECDPLMLVSKVFILEEVYSKLPYVVRYYKLLYVDDNIQILIGKFKQDFEDAITLEVDNMFLYSDHLHLLYDLETQFGLELFKIKQLDLCCDSNQNLPRKLNDAMHRTDCTVTRKGRFKVTDKGNQILGAKVSNNVKRLPGKDRERPSTSYYMEIHPSGSKQALKLRCYNKTEEIETKSQKHYIKDSCSFSGTIFRLEVSLSCQVISRQMKNKTGNWTHQEIYRNLTNIDFLKELFKFHLNRIATLTIKNKRFSISEFLRLK